MARNIQLHAGQYHASVVLEPKHEGPTIYPADHEFHDRYGGKSHYNHGEGTTDGWCRDGSVMLIRGYRTDVPFCKATAQGFKGGAHDLSEPLVWAPYLKGKHCFEVANGAPAVVRMHDTIHMLEPSLLQFFLREPFRAPSRATQVTIPFCFNPEHGMVSVTYPVTLHGEWQPAQVRTTLMAVLYPELRYPRERFDDGYECTGDFHFEDWRPIYVNHRGTFLVEAPGGIATQVRNMREIFAAPAEKFSQIFAGRIRVFGKDLIAYDEPFVTFFLLSNLCPVTFGAGSDFPYLQGAQPGTILDHDDEMNAWGGDEEALDRIRQKLCVAAAKRMRSRGK